MLLSLVVAAALAQPTGRSQASQGKTGRAAAGAAELREWTPEQLAEVFIDVPGFAKSLVRKGRTGDLAQAEARYVAGDGTAVLAVASWEAGVPAMKLEDAIEEASDVRVSPPSLR